MGCVCLPSAVNLCLLRASKRACETATNTESFRAIAQKLNQPVVFLDRAAFTKRAAEDYRIKAELNKTLDISAQ